MTIEDGRKPQDVLPSEETPEEVFQRFLGFARNPFSTEDALRFPRIVTKWVDNMDILFGNPELMRIDKNEAYREVPGIEDTLREAFEWGSLPGLKGEFIKQSLVHTKISSTTDDMLPALTRILNFK